MQCATDGYGSINSPFHPSEEYPELPFLKGVTLSAVPNRIYAGVRRALINLDLDKEHLGTVEWNPLADLVGPGQTVVMKPNLVCDSNPQPGGTTDSLVTHLSVIRPLVDYALKAIDFRGRLVICDAPQQNCDLDHLISYWGISQLQSFYREHFNFDVEFIDLRCEAVTFRDGVIVSRTALSGDPAGYTGLDLGNKSAFADIPDKLRMLRGADYDHEATIAHHTGGRHEYLISNTVLNADLLINIPKIKTHKKAGVTLALKNLVGVNGDKNWLPHLRPGIPKGGGDEFPCSSVGRCFRSWAVERVRRWLKAGKFIWAIRQARRFERVFVPVDEERSGNWYGNDTIWRMVMDLNRCLYFGDRKTGTLSTDRPRRRVLVVMDGIVAGEGAGPLRPVDKPIGMVCASLDPVAADLAVVKVMGFDWSKIPKIVHAMKAQEFRFTDVEDPAQVAVSLGNLQEPEPQWLRLDDLSMNAHFVPHPGWKVLVPDVVNHCPP